MVLIKRKKTFVIIIVVKPLNSRAYHNITQHVKIICLGMKLNFTHLSFTSVIFFSFTIVIIFSSYLSSFNVLIGAKH